jgi:hypothetical protein
VKRSYAHGKFWKISGNCKKIQTILEFQTKFEKLKSKYRQNAKIFPDKL